MVIVVHDFDIYTALSDDEYCYESFIVLSGTCFWYACLKQYVHVLLISFSTAFGLLFLAGSVYLTKAVLGKISFVPEVSK